MTPRHDLAFFNDISNIVWPDVAALLVSTGLYALLEANLVI